MQLNYYESYLLELGCLILEINVPESFVPESCSRIITRYSSVSAHSFFYLYSYFSQFMMKFFFSVRHESELLTEPISMY